MNILVRRKKFPSHSLHSHDPGKHILLIIFIIFYYFHIFYDPTHNSPPRCHIPFSRKLNVKTLWMSEIVCRLLCLCVRSGALRRGEKSVKSPIKRNNTNNTRRLYCVQPSAGWWIDALCDSIRRTTECGIWALLGCIMPLPWPYISIIIINQWAVPAVRFYCCCYHQHHYQPLK